MHIFWKYITDSSLKMLCAGIFVTHTLCSLYWNQKKFCKPPQREDNSYNLPIWQSKFSYELTFWFISIENGGKQKSKTTLRVAINQICDGLRDTMRSSYTIDKMWGVKLPHPLLKK